MPSPPTTEHRAAVAAALLIAASTLITGAAIALSPDTATTNDDHVTEFNAGIGSLSCTAGMEQKPPTLHSSGLPTVPGTDDDTNYEPDEVSMTSDAFRTAEKQNETGHTIAWIIRPEVDRDVRSIIEMGALGELGKESITTPTGHSPPQMEIDARLEHPVFVHVDVLTADANIHRFIAPVCSASKPN